MASENGGNSPAPEIGRLQSTFITSPYQSHTSKWDSLWKESYTPWDRGGPSLALADLITSHPNLFPAATETERKKALVPGCGRGYDAVLLSVLGYDVVGLDYSAVAVEEARRNEGKMAGEGVWEEVQPVQGREKGSVTWVQGDFFDDGWLEQTGMGKGAFDLIFDYTFFCALPPEARPRWAKRMAELLNPEYGRLVCLEWPLAKDPSTGGPPWGLSAEVYLAHLGRPGEEVKYGGGGKLVEEEETNIAGSPGGLRRLARVKPTRTHKAGYDAEAKVTDFISVWAHSLA